MHTIACARAHEASCACACNHTLHGYRSGVLSTEQHRRVHEPIVQAVATATGADPSVHADHALHELDRLLGRASAHLAAGALSGDTLHALVTTVLDAAADQERADADVVATATAVATDALAVADAAELATVQAFGAADAVVDAAARDTATAEQVAADAEWRAEAAEAETARVIAEEAAIADAATRTIDAAAGEVAAARDAAEAPSDAPVPPKPRKRPSRPPPGAPWTRRPLASTRPRPSPRRRWRGPTGPRPRPPGPSDGSI